jgi:hypothetical protein
MVDAGALDEDARRVIIDPDAIWLPSRPWVRGPISCLLEP